MDWCRLGRSASVKSPASRVTDCGLTCITLNADGALWKRALSLRDLMRDKGRPIDVACVVDAGCIDSRTIEAFKPTHTVFHHLPEVGSTQFTCAIIVRRDLATDNHIRWDPSGRALAVDIVPLRGRGKRVLRVIALYQPTGLDFPGGDTTEAHRLRGVVNGWSQHRSVCQSILGMDGNETFFGPFDRLGPTVFETSHLDGPIHDMIEEDGWCDLYRLVHPVPGEYIAKSAEERGHTYFHHKGSSRIDYILMKPAPTASSAVIDVDTSRSLDTQHRPLICTVQADVAESFLPPIDLPAEKRIRLPDLSLADRITLADELDTTIRPLVASSVSALRSIKSDTDGQAKLSKVADTLRDRIRASADALGYLSAPGPLPISSTPRVITRWNLIRKLFQRVRHGVQKRYDAAFANDLSTFNAHGPAVLESIYRLTRLAALPITDLLNPPTSSDLMGWMDWLSRCPGTMKSIRSKLREVTRALPCSPPNSIKRLLRTHRGRGRYYKWASNGWMEPRTVSSATRPDGSSTKDPREYLPLVQERVARPFSVGKAAPAVLVRPTLSPSELETGRPDWWDETYSRDTAKDPDVEWPIMSPCAADELCRVLSAVGSGKSPGHDGILMDILRIGTGALGDMTTRPTGALTLILTEIVNASLLHSICPLTFKQGIIVMIPKPDAPGSDNVSDMRPITLLPELGKLTARVLANRLTNTLHQNPMHLHPAQRAYLRDGSTHQCLATLLSVIEDYQDRSRSGELVDLVVTSYDVKKAFDSIQMFSIRAACEGLNLPERFIKYVLATLEDAESRVRTAAGLTAAFPLRSSVRQGDPLAALLFIFVMDAMHRRFDMLGGANPTPGYTMAHGHTVRSLGYSDDTATVAGSWAEAQVQHQWVREFFAAHHLRLNSKKTHCVIGSGFHASEGKYTDPHARRLQGLSDSDVHDPAGGHPASSTVLQRCWTPCRSQCVCPSSLCPCDIDIHTWTSSHTFRYLGYQLRVDLESGPMRKSLAFTIFQTCQMIRRQRLTLVQASDILREFLYPKLELGLTLAHISLKQLNKWTSLIRSAILHVGHDLATCRLSTAALFLALGVNTLPLQADLLRATELGVLLRGGRTASGTFRSQCTEAVRLRLVSATQSDRGRIFASPAASPYLGHEAVSSAARPKAPGHWCSAAVSSLRALGHTLSWKRCYPHGPPWQPPCFSTEVPGSFEPALDCVLNPHAHTSTDSGLEFYCRNNTPHPGLIAFTDGSFHSGRSGWAVVLYKAGPDGRHPEIDSTPVVLTGSAPGDGANYTAEVRALLAVLHRIPIDVNVFIWSDALSALQVMERPFLPEFKRLRLGCRSLMLPLRTMRSARGLQSTQLGHVTSHTGGLDAISLGNAMADRQAGMAVDVPAPPALCFEEDFVFWRTGYHTTHVSGNLRASLMLTCTNTLLAKLRAFRSQGSLARDFGKDLLALLKTVRKTKDTRLLQFLICKATCQLRTTDKTLPGWWRTKLSLRCPLCSGTQDSSHPFVCPGNMAARLRGEQAARRSSHWLIRHVSNWGLFNAVHTRFLHEVLPNLMFYSPTAPDWQGDPVGMQAHIFPIVEHDRAAGMLGLLPPEFEDALLYLPQFTGTEGQLKDARKSLAKLLPVFQLKLLRSSLSVYEAWLLLANPPARPSEAVLPSAAQRGLKRLPDASFRHPRRVAPALRTSTAQRGLKRLPDASSRHPRRVAPALRTSTAATAP